MSDSTVSADSDLSLAAGFPSANYEAWRALAEAALKGGDFDRRLVSKTADGIALQPVYARAVDASATLRDAIGQPWRVAQRVDHPDADAASGLADADLTGGADMLSLVFPAGAAARGYGLACDTVADLDRSLTGVSLDMITVRVEPAPAGRINAALVAALLARRGHTPSGMSVSFGLDPIGSMLTMGGFSADWEETGRRLGDCVSTLSADGYAGPFLECDVRPFHDAGASEVQELAIALAIGVAYWRALVANGVDPVAAERALGWTFSVDADQFLSIAKLRAMRKLWGRVQEASGLAPRAIRIHTETAWRMMTRYDVAVNMLRATIATFSAGVGGADSVSVLPHTLACGLPDAMARRIARNTQMVLLDESNLWRVGDPAAGSGAFEQLTDALCQRAWLRFQEIERAGGIMAVLSDGTLQQAIATMHAERAVRVATGKLPMTGTSVFPLLDEVPVQTLDVPRDAHRGLPKLQAGRPDVPFAALTATLKDGATRAAVTPGPQAHLSVSKLSAARLAEPYEHLRDRAKSIQETTGRMPSVFLANLGPQAENGARTTWIKNLLAAGGVEGVTVAPGFTASGDVGKAFSDSGLAIACICGADDAYATLGDATAQMLKTVGARRVYIARKPSSAEAAMTGIGIDGHFYQGQDAVVALGQLLDALAEVKA
ncbi:MAG: methylmalonyl-CoA mutase subunit beta [Pseudomonadota bacterium]